MEQSVRRIHIVDYKINLHLGKIDKPRCTDNDNVSSIDCRLYTQQITPGTRHEGTPQN